MSKHSTEQNQHAPELTWAPEKLSLGYYRAKGGNVGDDLNAYLWPRLLPDRFVDDAPTVFIGIGSILDHRFDHYPNKLVFGTGARSADSVPRLDETWRVEFVRGPLTARALGVPYITDPAILVARMFPPRHGQCVGVVPYFESNLDTWALLARVGGYRLISPRQDVVSFVAALSECERVYCESMHGAILADALRVPWVPVSTRNAQREDETHHFKWTDWCKSMELEFAPLSLPAFWDTPRRTWKDGVKVALSLARLRAHSRLQLSDDRMLERRLQQIEERLDALRSA